MIKFKDEATKISPILKNKLFRKLKLSRWISDTSCPSKKLNFFGKNLCLVGCVLVCSKSECKLFYHLISNEQHYSNQLGRFCHQRQEIFLVIPISGPCFYFKWQSWNDQECPIFLHKGLFFLVNYWQLLVLHSVRPKPRSSFGIGAITFFCLNLNFWYYILKKTWCGSICQRHTRIFY